MVRQTHDYLIEKYRPLIRSIVRSYSKVVPSKWWPDLWSEAYYAAWQASRNYDPDKGHFAPLARQYITNQIRYFLRWLQNHWENEKTAVLEQPDESSGNPVYHPGVIYTDTVGIVDHYREDLETRILIDDYLNKYPELKLFAYGYNGREIGRMLGVNSSTALRRMQKAREKLRLELGIPEHQEEVFHKTCSICNTEKPSTEFYKNSRSPDGKSYECKACRELRRKYGKARKLVATGD